MDKMIIITEKKVYEWNWKRGLKNILLAVGGIAWIVAYSMLSRADFMDIIR